MAANNAKQSSQANTIKVTTTYPSLNLNAKAPPCLVLLGGSPENIGRQWTLDKGSLTLGRLPESDISINEGGLSKAHAKFTLTDDKVYLTDLGATNGTMVNGKALTPNQPTLIKNNDQIKTGLIIFKFLQKGLLSETSEKQRMQTELESAGAVQLELLPPKSEVRYHSVQITGRYRPASEVGGDWWWHWSVGNRVFALIADVTGHGAGAALLTSAARSTLIGLEGDATAGIDKVYTTLSNNIQKCAGGTLTMSAFIIEYDVKTAKLRYINACHPPMVLIPPHTSKTNMVWSSLPFVSTKPSDLVGASGQEFTISEITVATGSRLLMMTDGLIERESAPGTLIGHRRLCNMILEAHSEHSGNQTKFLDTLLAKSDEAAKSASQDDDITIVALDFLR